LRSAAIVAFTAIAVLAAGQNALAQNYPSRPIRIVVPFSAASQSDFLARVIGPKLLETWGQQVVVDNRPSAGGTVAGGIVASALPDGHTLMLTSSAFAVSAALYDKLPYDALKDFAGVTQVASTALVLVVAPALGVRSAGEFLELARRKPGQLAYGSAGIGSGTHFATEMLKLAAGLNIVHVPYKGAPEAMIDTMAGRNQFVLSPVVPALPLIRNGRLLALGVTTAQRVPVLPEVPAFSESALPAFEYDGWFGMFAPARTPRAVVNSLAKEVGRILALPDVTERILTQGAAPRSSSPAEFDRFVRAAIVERGKILRAAGVKAD
jgi:tripartite-type tricarboxylate transporter receptor subunit TctC